MGDSLPYIEEIEHLELARREWLELVIRQRRYRPSVLKVADAILDGQWGRQGQGGWGMHLHSPEELTHLIMQIGEDLVLVGQGLDPGRKPWQK